MVALALLVYLCFATYYISTVTGTATVILKVIHAKDKTGSTVITPANVHCIRTDDCQYEFTFCADFGIIPKMNCLTEKVVYSTGDRIDFFKNTELKRSSGHSLPVQTAFLFQVLDEHININSNNDYTPISPTEAGTIVITKIVDLRTGVVLNPSQNPNRTFEVVLSVITVCDPNYFTKKCNVFCEPKDDDINGHFTCDPDTGDKNCLTGYTGPKCTTIDRCHVDSVDCGANGRCCVDISTDTPGCCCDDGFTGSRCETTCDICASNPCQNGGTCVPGASSFTCICPDGCTGSNCESGETLRRVTLKLSSMILAKILSKCNVTAIGGGNTKSVTIEMSCGGVTCLEKYHNSSNTASSNKSNNKSSKTGSSNKSSKTGSSSENNNTGSSSESIKHSGGKSKHTGSSSESNKTGSSSENNNTGSSSESNKHSGGKSKHTGSSSESNNTGSSSK